jgi:hypothetical protein
MQGHSFSGGLQAFAAFSRVVVADAHGPAHRLAVFGDTNALSKTF